MGSSAIETHPPKLRCIVVSGSLEGGHSDVACTSAASASARRLQLVVPKRLFCTARTADREGTILPASTDGKRSGNKRVLGLLSTTIVLRCRKLHSS